MVPHSTTSVRSKANGIVVWFGVLLVVLSLIDVRGPTAQLYLSIVEIALCIGLCLFALFQLTAWTRVVTIGLAAVAATLAILQSADICAAWAFAVHPRVCPVCHVGIVLPPEPVAARAATEPSKNLGIWNGSYHGPNYQDYTKICTLCWMAYHPGLNYWERASEVPDAFYRPLTAAIRHVPLPSREHIHFRVVYTQYFRNQKFDESVEFWCDDIPPVLQPLRDYVAGHNLFFAADKASRKEGQVWVSIETNPPSI